MATYQYKAKAEEGQIVSGKLEVADEQAFFKEMDKMAKAALVGFGNRGGIYADYSLAYPEQLKIVGVVEVKTVTF